MQVSVGTRAFGVDIVAADLIGLNMEGLANVAEELKETSFSGNILWLRWTYVIYLIHELLETANQTNFTYQET